MRHANQPRSSYVYREYSGRKLYIIGEPGSPIVKIGIALRPDMRLQTIQAAANHTLIPEQIDRGSLLLLHEELGTRRLEAQLHHRFASRRVIGEWFDLGVMALPLIRSTIRDLRN